MVTASELVAPLRAATLPRIEWEETNCLLCGSAESSPYLEAPDNHPGMDGLRFAIVRCNRCGLCYTNPRPNFATIGQFYPDDYSPHRKARTFRKLQRRWHPFSWLTGRPCPERRTLPWLGEGRLLDFGCGGGSFLCRMEEQGWKVVGLDASPQVVQTLREELGFKAYLGTLPHPDLKPGSYDVVTMWCSLEHVHQPREALRAAYQLLAPGGRLYLAVPNIESWPFAWFRDRWYGLELPRHLTHFCPTTLRTMLEVTGFRVGYLRNVAHPEWLRHSWRIARRSRDTSLFQRLLRFKNFARFAAWICYLAGRSDCIMAMAERPTIS